MDAQKDILLKLLANNPDRIDFRVTLRTSWNLIQEQQFRSSSEGEIPQEKFGFPVQPPPLPLRGEGGGIPLGGGAGEVLFNRYIGPHACKHRDCKIAKRRPLSTPGAVMMRLSRNHGEYVTPRARGVSS